MTPRSLFTSGIQMQLSLRQTNSLSRIEFARSNSIQLSSGATCLRRRILLESWGEVKDNKTWWDGPKWLSEQENWPPDVVTKASKESDAEAKIIRELFASTVEVPDSFDNIMAKFGLSKALRVCAWVTKSTPATQINV